MGPLHLIHPPSCSLYCALIDGHSEATNVVFDIILRRIHSFSPTDFSVVPIQVLSQAWFKLNLLENNAVSLELFGSSPLVQFRLLSHARSWHINLFKTWFRQCQSRTRKTHQYNWFVNGIGTHAWGSQFASFIDPSEWYTKSLSFII